MLNVLKSLVNSFHLPAVFPEEEERSPAILSFARLKRLHQELKLRANQAYDGHKANAKLAW